ncbi:MAG: SDR family oxidoreductase [Actinomycetota bacterium]|nr:SDR family oxidoreductase [Actinomycetota bacterium]
MDEEAVDLLHPLLASRWSPTTFDPSARVSPAEVESLLEAARWAPSAGNSQPWAFIVGARGEPEHDRLVRHLAKSSAIWAPTAGVLIGNAGPFAEHGFVDATDADWTSAFAGNVISAVGCARGVIPAMRRAGWGRIITIGTRGVATPLPNMVEYSAAKAALVNATKALARELAGTGITANVVSPGVILTPGLREMFESRARAGGDDRSWEDIEGEVVADYAPNPVGRLGRPEDIAAAVAFLSSPLADYITGATLRVDGGITPSVNP